MSLFKGKYRIETARLANWDYASEAAYFVTICTKNRYHYFGKIENDEITLNDIGIIVRDEWLKTPALRQDMNLMLDEFAIMPNHFHCIIFIDNNKYNTPITTNNTTGRDAMLASPNNTGIASPHNTGIASPHNTGIASPHNTGIASPDNTNIGDPSIASLRKFGPQSKNLSAIIRGFKSSVTKLAHEINPDFGWQERFHDHIIKNHESYVHIRNYIINNPVNWKEDTFYSV